MNKYRLLSLSTIATLSFLLSEYRATTPKTPQQSLAKEEGNLEEIVPQGWKVSHATGDLNKD